MRYASVCSGIGAPECAWQDTWGAPVYMSEIAPFPKAVLKAHFPEVPNYGDFTTIKRPAPADLLVAGTPCQDFSVAGLRAGLGGERGHLTIEFCRLLSRARPRWVVWENVAGVLSVDGGRAFGTFLGLLGQCGYGWAYRLFDAQYAGVPQRRRRIFLVGYLGDWRPPAAVLFERDGLSGYPPPRREARQGSATGVEGGTRSDSEPIPFDLAQITSSTNPVRAAPGLPASTLNGAGQMHVARALTSHPDRQDATVDTYVIQNGARAHREYSNGLGVAESVCYTLDTAGQHAVAHSLRGAGSDASEDGTGRGTPLVPWSFNWQSGGDCRIDPQEDRCGALHSGQTPAIAFDWQKGDGGADESFRGLSRSWITRAGDYTGALGESKRDAIAQEMTVRRLTPTECERLMGFPDGWTAITYRKKPAKDGPRYAALGNSMVVNELRWIGQRIAMVDALPRP